MPPPKKSSRIKLLLNNELTLNDPPPQGRDCRTTSSRARQTFPQEHVGFAKWYFH